MIAIPRQLRTAILSMALAGPAISSSFDSVGNRKQIASTLAPVPAGLFNYDANDCFTARDAEACPERSRRDNDGNTVSSGGIANVYDFENHLVQKGGVTIVYDGDGNRVSKTVAGVTTTYLVDSLNPTGYAQVVYETFSGSSAPNRELNHVYVYGLELLGQTRNYVANSQSNTQQIYYDYDGHGSVRALTDPNGNVTDTYDYDAFGNLIHSTGTTPNNYLYSGEQFDQDLNLYYNRARYLNTSTDRFWTADTAEPTPADPTSLHRYLYANADPVNALDPSGLYPSGYGDEVDQIVGSEYEADFGYSQRQVFLSKYKDDNPLSALTPDILDLRWTRGDGSRGKIWMEIKPLTLSGIGRATAAWGLYEGTFGQVGVNPGVDWLAGGKIFPSSQGPVLVFNRAGILFYTTSQEDYEYFQEVLEAAFGLGSGATVGGLAGQLVNTLVRSLPQVPASPGAGSEIIDIGSKARIAIQGSTAATETDEALDLVA